jgi:putative endonuclease
MTAAETGRIGERLAARYLRRSGYRILERNWRSHQHEIDIIAREKRTGTVVFVEVKTRTPGSFGRPADAVDRNKQRFLRLAAQSWLIANGGLEQPARFDVIEVLLPEKHVNHIPNAF